MEQAKERTEGPRAGYVGGCDLLHTGSSALFSTGFLPFSPDRICLHSPARGNNLRQIPKGEKMGQEKLGEDCEWRASKLSEGGKQTLVFKMLMSELYGK